METTLPREIKSTVATRMFENPSLPLIPTTSKSPSAQFFISRSITSGQFCDGIRLKLENDFMKEREPPVKSVFWALFGAIYLCYGMPEVYRVLFEVFGMDPDADECQPRSRRQLEDPPEDALFAHPRLFRACVPPGMHRFRGNIWDFDSKPKVMQTLGYPLPMNDRIKEITEARNIELGLGLQLCFLHPSKHKFEHPRFCFERLEYVGQKIQWSIL
ncbi:unnamed protein product [Arabidopsis lyrata]|nr:unnamed protein product [Arabidopsis lyrata]